MAFTYSFARENCFENIEFKRKDCIMAARKWYWAVLLTFLQPGLGHMYAGRLGRGAALWAASIVLFMLAFLAGLAGTFAGLAGLMCLGVAAYLALAADAALLCRAGRFTPKRYNRWYLYLAAFIAAYAATSALQYTRFLGTLDFRAFRIPSESMAATLLPGDHVYVDMTAFKKREPKAGDMVLMLYSRSQPVHYIKRIAAGPGDTVQLSGGRMTVNGREYGLLDHAPAGSADAGPSRDMKAVLGPDEFFVVGDNAGHSMDSRYFGPVKRGAILGKPAYIYYSDVPERIGKTF